MSILSEFKEFAIKGNVIDMAVGVVVGTAFSKIVTSLVNDIIMPPIGYLLGGVKFSDLVITIAPNVTVNYGSFIQTVIDFLIVAVSMFVVVKIANALRRLNIEKLEDKNVLTEIRDLLKDQHTKTDDSK